MTTAPSFPLGAPPLQQAAGQAYRLAAHQMVRIARDQGAVEAAHFYCDLSSAEQLHVAVIIARLAGGRLETPPPDDTSPWWTDEELRRCHNLFVHGYRSTWVEKGQKLYMRHHQRRRRAGQATTTARVTPEATRQVVPRPPNWTTEEDARIMAEDRPSDAELALELGRSKMAIHSRRGLLRKAAAVPE